VAKIEPKGFIEKAAGYFKSALRAPFVMLGKIIAVTLLGVIIRSVSANEDTLSKVFEIICVVCTVAIITDTVKNSFQSVQDSINGINTYLIAYLPVYSGITAAGGNVIGSNGYLAIMLFVCEIMGTIASRILLPFLSMVLAVTLVSAINPRLNFTDVANSVKKVVTVGLGLLMTVFTGIMAIQGITGAAADNVSTKALKFAASSFIPVIGNSVSEAYSTVKGSLGIIRSTVGSIGIIVLFLIIIKPVITIMAVKFSIFLAKCVNDIFGRAQISGLLKSVNSVLSIAVSIIIAYALIFTVATTVLMMTAFNLGG
jgi:stage III sporulation protein AE